MVADHLAGEGGEDRREGGDARALPRLPDGRGGGAASLVPGHPHAIRGAAAACRSTMLTREGLLSPQSQGRRVSAARPMTAIRGAGATLARRVDRLPTRIWLQGARNRLPSGSQEGYGPIRRGSTPSIWEMSVESESSGPAKAPLVEWLARGTTPRSQLTLGQETCEKQSDWTTPRSDIRRSRSALLGGHP